jgi:TonB family protein
MANSLGAAAVFTALLLAGAVSAEPAAAPTVTVVGKRPLKPCAERETGCIAAVADRLWTEFPQQLETFCTGQIVSRERQRQNLEDFLGMGGSDLAIAANASSPLDDRLPRALAQVCEQPKQHGWQPLAQTWAPWASVPGDTDIAAAGAGKLGDARLYCRINRDGRLSRCTVSDENPARSGLGGAALKLTGKFAARVDQNAPYDPASAWVEIMVHFGPSAQPRPITLPDWTTVPDAGPLYPAAATAAGVKSGAGRVDCGIGDSGQLADCRLLDEAPGDLGFGAAALAEAQGMRMNLWTRDGLRTPGGRVVVPLRFNAP